MQFRAIVQWATIGQGEDQKESFSHSDVLFAHWFEFFLSCRVENLQMGDLVIDQTLFDVGIFNGWIIIREEEWLDELNGNRRLEEHLRWSRLSLSLCSTSIALIVSMPEHAEQWHHQTICHLLGRNHCQMLCFSLLNRPPLDLLCPHLHCRERWACRSASLGFFYPSCVVDFVASLSTRLLNGSDEKWCLPLSLVVSKMRKRTVDRCDVEKKRQCDFTLSPFILSFSLSFARLPWSSRDIFFIPVCRETIWHICVPL